MINNQSDLSLNWSAHLLRLTVFPAKAVTYPDPSAWWQALLGDQPETTVSLARQGAYRVGGPFHDGMLHLSVSSNQPSRIDWIWTVREPGTDEDVVPLGSAADAVRMFRTTLDSWLTSKSCPKCVRVAFGSTLGQEVSDRVAGYRSLQPYIQQTVRLDAEHSSDFLYQINRPTVSKSVKSVTLNRLSRWSVATGQTLTLVVGSSVANFALERPRLTCQLELDINTDAERTIPLPQARLNGVFEELTALGMTIAENGDQLD